MIRKTLALVGLLGVLVTGCDGDPYVEQGFALLDQVAPERYEMIEETTERSSAIRRFEVDGGTPSPEDLGLPDGYTRNDDLDSFAGAVDPGWELAAVWHGPSPAEGQRCALYFSTRSGVAPQPGDAAGDGQRVELVATCALR